MSKSFVVYILQSDLDKTFYVGYTTDIQQRLKEHNQGKSRYTKGHRPYKVVYLENCPNLATAKHREIEIKQYKNTESFLKSRVPPTLLSRD
ncbi:GIY-YIG nuclease family protein [Candidatus Collierbacteria bacterium]|nr:GIY-YIG nuclease family protein [Candidatus Collierbacteria bacterium]